MVLCATSSTRNSEKTRVLRRKKSVEIDRPLFQDATHRFLPLFLSFYPGPERFTFKLGRKKEESIRCARRKIKSTRFFHGSRLRGDHFTKVSAVCRFSLKATRSLRMIRLRLSSIFFSHVDSILVSYLAFRLFVLPSIFKFKHLFSIFISIVLTL